MYCQCLNHVTKSYMIMNNFALLLKIYLVESQWYVVACIALTCRILSSQATKPSHSTQPKTEMGDDVASLIVGMMEGLWNDQSWLRW